MSNEDGINIVLDEVKKQHPDARKLNDLSVGYDFKKDGSSVYVGFNSFCRLDEETIRFQTRRSLMNLDCGRMRAEGINLR